MHMHDKNTAGQCACDTDDQHVHREAKKHLDSTTSWQ